MKARRRPNLFEVTKEQWPPRLHEFRASDARLKEYLMHLEETLAAGEPEPILWVICAGVWWLEPHEAREVAALLKETLESRPS